MSLTVPPVQSAHAQTEPPQVAALPPKPASTQSALPEDKVTISDSAKQPASTNTSPTISATGHH
jgi:hypothetical protein